MQMASKLIMQCHYRLPSKLKLNARRTFSSSSPTRKQSFSIKIAKN
jgi:hypothetical protein